MTKEKTTVEVLASTVEDAIEQGLDQLGLPRDAVEIEIMDKGHQGFLGLGNKDVRVKMTVKEVPLPKITRKSTPPPIANVKKEPIFSEEPDKIEINKNERWFRQFCL